MYEYAGHFPSNPACQYVQELDGAPEQSHLLVSPVPAIFARSPLLIAKLMQIAGVNPHQEILEMAGAGIASPMVLSVNYRLVVLKQSGDCGKAQPQR